MKFKFANIVLVYSLLCFLICVLSSCVNKTKREYEVYNIRTKFVNVDSTCFSDNYDMEIIKLENSKNSLISQVHKLIVNSKGILVYDNSSVPQVFSFDQSGNFISKIGKYGHAKNEYDHILDVCSNDKGDSIVLLQFGRTKLFDDKGNYLSSCSIDTKYHWEHIERSCNGGYIGASEYTYADDLISICDNSFNIIYDLVNSKDITVEHGSYVWNPIWSSHGKIVFCDFYFSSIYVTDVETSQTTCYKINTGNTAPVEDVKNGIYDYDNFLDVEYDGKYVFGHIIHKKRCNMFKFDIEKRSFIIYGCVEDWYPTIKAYHDGYFYAVLTPTFLLSLLKEEPRYMYKKTYAALRKALEPYADDLNEMDNLYILKMKKKIKK